MHINGKSKKIKPNLPYGWEDKYGEDKTGIWISFIIKGVRQVLRWIYPGEFMMGSPVSEPEREKNETLHKVIIAKGFWLAETVCTQELWGKTVAGLKENSYQWKG